LHVGATHEAVIVAPPAPGLLTPPVLLTLATAVFEELQVRVGAIGFPATSTTVGVMLELVPLGAVIVVPPVALTANAMDCTGHVVKDIGPLIVFAIPAET
jgi:hypothetical protein